MCVELDGCAHRNEHLVVLLARRKLGARSPHPPSSSFGLGCRLPPFACLSAAAAATLDGIGGARLGPECDEDVDLDAQGRDQVEVGAILDALLLHWAQLGVDLLGEVEKDLGDAPEKPGRGRGRGKDRRVVRLRRPFTSIAAFLSQLLLWG